MIATIAAFDVHGIGAALLFLVAAAIAWSAWRKSSSSSSPLVPAPLVASPVIAAAEANVDTPPPPDKVAVGFQALRALDEIYKGLGVSEDDRRERMVDGVRNIFSANEPPPSLTP